MQSVIVTAFQISNLNLLTTRLVVVSACSSGAGESVCGEGVLGLGRAFLLAGARSTVLALWSIHDEHTRQLMDDFYTVSLQDRAVALLRRGVPRSAQVPWILSFSDLFARFAVLFLSVIGVGVSVKGSSPAKATNRYRGEGRPTRTNDKHKNTPTQTNEEHEHPDGT